MTTLSRTLLALLFTFAAGATACAGEPEDLDEDAVGAEQDEEPSAETSQAVSRVEYLRKVGPAYCARFGAKACVDRSFFGCCPKSQSCAACKRARALTGNPY
jgi:hypothetical protein